MSLFDLLRICSLAPSASDANGSVFHRSLIFSPSVSHPVDDVLGLVDWCILKANVPCET